MIPWTLLPGLAHLDLEGLAARPEPIWIHGPAGSGRSSLALELASLRGRKPAEASAPPATGAVTSSSSPPTDPRWVALKLLPLDEAPESISGLVHAIAKEEAIHGDVPAALSRLPCPGNLRELRNRVLRFKLLGQLPETPEAATPLFEAEDLATNLHHLEAFLLHRALRRSYGNRVEAAKRLGVSRRHLYILIQRHGDPVKGEAGSGAMPRRMAKRKT